ncbi:hypothetical protein B0H17DRAFT_1206900 [Mycena rosella]|uniref:Uncharacterized protein n=1 Tax=Mycena rosella TaxID=1033263 RepID=A0AAD7GB34_MYCRO|nr:hypothetical protein B0H17DRAFT_1206900 [Mycena rosella]
MGSLCFSSASILRCESFTTLESKVLLIPTALELIFSTTLIFTNWGTGWRHLLLTAEGWSYFALALLELLSHTLPAVRDSVTVFSIVDIVLGATSFVPIFFYTLFVYLFTRGELIDTLPKRFQSIANWLLLFFIPAIVALNELSSFIGISRRSLLLGDGREVVAIGFKSINDQQLWTFLTSLTLALLTAFEAINFCFAFYRLVRAFIDQRRIETTSTDQAHLIRGIGWITGGFKLGAVETVIGFAQGGFGGALTRRILRFLARAFLIIGIVQGVDEMDDFADITKEMSSGRQQFRRSRLGMMISNPRFSTFRQLSPNATAFRAQAEPKPEMSEFAQLKREVTTIRPDNISGLRPQQRVTVQFESGAPTLHMRFSGLEMPSPAVIAEKVKSRPLSSSWVSIARSSRYAPSIAPSFAFGEPVPTTYPEFIFERKPSQENRGTMFSTASSAYPDSLTAVRELAAQFPGPPPAVATPIMERDDERSGWDEDLESQLPSRRDSAYSSVRRAPAPVFADPFNQASTSSPEAAPMRYAYGGMEYPESPEPVYRYAYDGPVSPEELQPYAAYSPPREAQPYSGGVRSDTTLGNTPMAYLSPFDQDAASTPDTEDNNSDPFQYDQDAPAILTGLSSKAPYTTQPVYMDDGPRATPRGPRQGGEIVQPRTSAALLQMTQRGDGGVSEAWTPPEFTPSLFSAVEDTSSVRTRGTLKKRRPSVKSNERPVFTAAASVETLASSWLHGDMEDEERPTSMAPVPARVKSVGRVRAPYKTTPVPVRGHGMTRGSVYIQPIHVPPTGFSSEVLLVQGGGSADSYNSEFTDRP